MVLLFVLGAIIGSGSCIILDLARDNNMKSNIIEDYKKQLDEKDKEVLNE